MRPVFPENRKDDVAHFSSNRANSDQMMLSPCLERLVVFRQNGITKRRPVGGKPNSPPKIRRAALRDMLLCSLKLA